MIAGSLMHFIAILFYVGWNRVKMPPDYFEHEQACDFREESPTGRTIRATASSPPMAAANRSSHIKAFARRQPRPVGEEIVTYELQQDKQGRLRASAVRSCAAPGASVSLPWGRPLAAGIGRFVLCIFGRSHRRRQDASAVTRLLRRDQHHRLHCLCAGQIGSARDGRWRIAENTLHLLALLGGWPGALLAQYRLRHKSSKPAFLIIFWATVLLNCGALGLLLTPTGGRAL